MRSPGVESQKHVCIRMYHICFCGAFISEAVSEAAYVGSAEGYLIAFLFSGGGSVVSGAASSVPSTACVEQ